MGNAVTNSPAREYVNRIEAIEQEQAGLASDKRDLYAEAEASGLVVKALRALIRKRKQDKEQREALDQLVHQYEMEL